MSGDRVLLLELRERTSAAGNRYLSGWLGKASVVAFLDREAEEPTWQVFVSTPRQSGGTSSTSAKPSRRPSRRAAQPVPDGVLNDDVSDIGGGYWEGGE